MNLLPYSYLDALKQETRVRLLALVSIAAALALLCVTLLLLALSLYVRGQSWSAEFLLNSARANSGALETARLNLETFNAMTNDLDLLLRTRVSSSDILRVVAQNLPEDVSLSSFSVKIALANAAGIAKGDIQVFVSGFAKSRDSLLVFRDRLEQQPMLSRVVFPAASWASPGNITFSFTTTALQSQ